MEAFLVRCYGGPIAAGPQQNMPRGDTTSKTYQTKKVPHPSTSKAVDDRHQTHVEQRKDGEKEEESTCRFFSSQFPSTNPRGGET
jgi:hypothetical protein